MVRKNNTKKKPKVVKKKKSVEFAQAGVLPKVEPGELFDRGNARMLLVAFFIAAVLYSLVYYVAKSQTAFVSHLVETTEEKWTPVPIDQSVVIPEETPYLESKKKVS